MKKLSDTRWACRSDAVVAVSKHYVAVLKALDEEIKEHSQQAKATAEASGLSHQLK